MSILNELENYIKENESVSIDIDIDGDDETVGSVNGIVHFDRSYLNNWLDSQKVDTQASKYISDIADDDLLPIGILNNINVYDGYRNKGYGTEGLDSFIDKVADEYAKYVILISDANEEQGKGFDLKSWYEEYGFKNIGMSGNDFVMIYDLMGN
jgi:hypothetical protein